MNVDKKFLRESYEKYRVGDPTTDEELHAVYWYYHTLNKAFDSLYLSKYHLVANDVYNNLITIEGYIKARKERSNKV